MHTVHIITRLIVGGAQENTLHTVDNQQHLFGDRVTLLTGPGLGPEGSLEERAETARSRCANHPAAPPRDSPLE